MRKNLPALFAFALIFNLLSAFSFAAGAVDPAKWTEGRSLFKSNCASCHNPKVAQTGPALMGVTARWEAAGDFGGKTADQWLHIWIHNWSDAVAGKYPYAVNIQNYAPSEMNRFPNLKDDDIDKILLYVNNPDSGPGAAPVAAGGVGAAVANAPGGEKAPENNTTLYLLVGLMFVLVFILVGVTRRLDRVVEEKKGIVAEPKTPFYKTRSFKAATILILFVGSIFWLAQNGIRLGRQKGYEPTQPIRFSHQLHAGKHKIDCQYCHTSAAKGKASGIPTLNTCMNCHKAITTGPVYGKEEIAKIYKAVGWDADKKVYNGTPHPIEWVRIHNLPDHVYFNHSQHVVAGKVACQTCHGPVETMAEVYQFAPLSMGWCVNCHRQTEVQFASNNYYSTYEKLHEDLKNKKIDKVTVEKIGGTECGKCHY
jgi:mono/diheme cytochrome c family protein